MTRAELIKKAQMRILENKTVDNFAQEYDLNIIESEKLWFYAKQGLNVLIKKFSGVGQIIKKGE